MSTYLTLVAGPGAGDLAPELVESLARRLPGQGAIAARRWLHEPVALDLEVVGLTEADRRRLPAIVSDVLSGERLDWSLSPATGRRKRLLVADMESTIIENELLPELADLAGHGETVAALTAQAMGGRLEFDAVLVQRVALLEGLPADSIACVSKNIRYTSGARTLVGTMKDKGARLALVSSGFRGFAEIVAEELGFDECHANQLEVTDAALTGRVVPPILNGESKRTILGEIGLRWSLEPQATLAVGDGANDLKMLRAAGLGVSFHASPAVAAEAPVRVDHGDLTTLLYFQGFSRDEFVL